MCRGCSVVVPVHIRVAVCSNVVEGKVKNEWSSTSLLLYAFMACTWTPFPLLRMIRKLEDNINMDTKGLLDLMKPERDNKWPNSKKEVR